MIGIIKDKQGNFLSEIRRDIFNNGGIQYHRYTDSIGNIFLEKPYEECEDGYKLICLLKVGIDKYYPDSDFGMNSGG
jgi:hypothetical protein